MWMERKLLLLAADAQRVSNLPSMQSLALTTSLLMMARNGWICMRELRAGDGAGGGCGAGGGEGGCGGGGDEGGGDGGDNRGGGGGAEGESGGAGLGDGDGGGNGAGLGGGDSGELYTVSSAMET